MDTRCVANVVGCSILGEVDAGAVSTFEERMHRIIQNAPNQSTSTLYMTRIKLIQRTDGVNTGQRK